MDVWSVLHKISPSTTVYRISLKKVKLHELIYKKPEKFYVSSNNQQGVNLTWTVNNQQGSVTWIITNTTNQQVSVGLYRGVPNYSPIYFFGEAFNMVYLANNLVSPCTSPQQEFCLGIYAFRGFMRFPAFVFNLPPNTQYQITEYGFPPNPQIVAKLVPLKPLTEVNAVVFYNPILPQIYMEESGQQVSYEPDPFIMTAMVYDMPENVLNEFGYLVLANNFFVNNAVMFGVYQFLLNFPITLSII